MSAPPACMLLPPSPFGCRSHHQLHCDCRAQERHPGQRHCVLGRQSGSRQQGAPGLAGWWSLCARPCTGTILPSGRVPNSHPCVGPCLCLVLQPIVYFRASDLEPGVEYDFVPVAENYVGPGPEGPAYPFVVPAMCGLQAAAWLNVLLLTAGVALFGSHQPGPITA